LPADARRGDDTEHVERRFGEVRRQRSPRDLRRPTRGPARVAGASRQGALPRLELRPSTRASWFSSLTRRGSIASQTADAAGLGAPSLDLAASALPWEGE